MGAVRRLPGSVTRKISPMTIATKKTPMATSTLDLLARVVTVPSLWPATGPVRRTQNPRVLGPTDWARCGPERRHRDHPREEIQGRGGHRGPGGGPDFGGPGCRRSPIR